MSLGRSRQKHGKPLSDDSLKDALYDQLLASLSQGGEPLPDDREYWEFLQERHRVYGDVVDDPDSRWPWPMQRKRAFELLRALTWEAWYNLQKVISEAEQASNGKNGNLPDLNSEEQVKVEWFAWRSEMIQKYRLEECSLLQEMKNN